MEVSRVDDQWIIGKVQTWWLLYEDLQARSKSFPSPAEFQTAENALIDTFPTCGTELATPGEAGTVRARP